MIAADISSPKFPDGYSPLYDCVDIIHSIPGSTITLFMEYVDVEYEEKCRYDYLKVRVLSVACTFIIAAFLKYIQHM